MGKLLKAMKEKGKDKKIKEQGKQALRFIQKNEKLEQRIAKLQEGSTEEMMKNITTESAEDQGQQEDTVTREDCNAEGDALQEENTLKEEKASEQLENEARLLMNYVTPYALLPGQEKQWYQIITERVESIQNKSVAEILSALLPHVVRHPEIEKRLRQQLKKSQKETFNGTIWQCLKKIMKKYVSPEGVPARRQHLAHVVKAKELTSTSKNNNNSLLISGNAGIAESKEPPDPTNKVKKTIRKRCHFCKKRGHIRKNCPIEQKCWNWMKQSSY